MTREEAIAKIGHIIDCIELGIFCGEDEEVFEALSLALAALRGPTREMVERMRGEWIDEMHTTISGRGRVIHSTKYTCAACKKSNGRLKTGFCPRCGAPMTDEAVQMVMERLEALKDGKDRSI